jgi:glycosyltransferase A (GT-A) superfamily protein (DUF2064 family)
MSADVTIAVMAKRPVPGEVKTRLVPPCSEQQAAHLAQAALADTLDVVSQTPARRRLLVLDGDVDHWLPSGFAVVPQVPGTLDVRLAAVLETVDGPLVLIGMDTPQITPDLLCFDFDVRSAWLGLAEDGGFWALGLAEPDGALVRGVPMSVPHTGAAQRRRLVDAGLVVGDLPVLRDVDTWDDALAVAELVPESRFGRGMHMIRRQVASGGRRPAR